MIWLNKTGHLLHAIKFDIADLKYVFLYILAYFNLFCLEYSTKTCTIYKLLQILRTKMEWIVSSPRHHVRIWYFCSDALLPRSSNGKCIFILFLFLLMQKLFLIFYLRIWPISTVSMMLNNMKHTHIIRELMRKELQHVSRVPVEK